MNIAIKKLLLSVSIVSIDMVEITQLVPEFKIYNIVYDYIRYFKRHFIFSGFEK